MTIPILVRPGGRRQPGELHTEHMAAGGWWLRRDGAWVFLGLEEEQVPSVAPSVAVPGAGRGTALVL